MTASKVHGFKEKSLAQKVADLQLTLNDIRGSQITFNSQVKSHMDLSPISEKRTAKHESLIKRILSKVKDQEVRIDTLMKVLGGRFRNQTCDCGKNMTLINFMEEKNDMEHDSQKISDEDSSSTETGESEDTNRKRKRKKKTKKSKLVEETPDEPDIEKVDVEPIEDITTANINKISAMENIPTKDDDDISTCSKANSTVVHQSSNKDYSVYSLREDVFFDFHSVRSHKSYKAANWLEILKGDSDTFIKSSLFYLPVGRSDCAGSIKLRGYSKIHFEVLFGVPETKFNKNVKFPVRVSINAKIFRKGSAALETKEHRFIVDQPGHYRAENKKFLIEFKSQDWGYFPQLSFKIIVL